MAMDCLSGRAHRFGSDVNTDEIIPARFLVTADARELGQGCMEGARPGFGRVAQPGDIIVAGNNFGCGSSREHAPLSIKGLGISCVIACSFARIFYRNAINIGLPILQCRDAAKIKEGDALRVYLRQGLIEDKTQNRAYNSGGYPDFMREIISAGGLMAWIKSRG